MTSSLESLLSSLNFNLLSKSSISENPVDVVSLHATTSPLSFIAMKSCLNCVINLLSDFLTSPMFLEILNVYMIARQGSCFEVFHVFLVKVFVPIKQIQK